MTLSRVSLFHYALLAIPLAFAGMPLYLHAPDFYATQQGLSLTTLGVILLAVRAFDALQDPIIGYWSDRLNTYRLPFLWAAMVLLALGFFGLFHPLAGVPLWLWFAVSLLLTTTAFSILTINLAALGGLWSADPAQQMRITTTREAFGLLGLILAATLPLWLQQYFSAEQSYRYDAMAVAVLLAIAGVAFTRWFRRFAQNASPPSSQKKLLLRHLLQQHSRFYLIYGLSALASAIPAVLLLFFTRDRLGAESLNSLFLLIYFLAGILAMPLWRKLANRHGASTSWLMAMVLAVVSFGWAFLLSFGDVTAFGIICALSGMALGAELALPPVILTDLIARDMSQSRIAVQFSVLAFLSKAALALAAGGILPLLQLAGYHPAAANSEAALSALSLCYALLPCLLKVIAAALLFHWRNQHLHQGD